MPTYEYECERCGHRFERFQKITDDSVPACPKCGGDVRKIIAGGAGIIFKGPGFYATDYRKSNGRGRDGGEKPRPSDESGGSSDE